MDRYKEYGGTSLRGGGADLMGPNMDYIRRDVVDTWDYDSDVVEINRMNSGLTTVGYIAFNRKRGFYHWITATKTCREFDPATGKLGKAVPMPDAVRSIIADYEKKMAEKKAKAKAKKTVSKPKTIKKKTAIKKW